MSPIIICNIPERFAKAKQGPASQHASGPMLFFALSARSFGPQVPSTNEAFAANPECDEFPGNREKNREISPFSVIFGQTVSKNQTILGHSSKIPCAVEQGIFLAEQGIQIPCSDESRDISAGVRPLTETLLIG